MQYMFINSMLFQIIKDKNTVFLKKSKAHINYKRISMSCHMIISSIFQLDVFSICWQCIILIIQQSRQFLLFQESQMSKQRKSDIKDNNISSKLLGANISDINIEKFRDLTQYRKNKYDLGGKVTVPILKTITNKFSPAVIFTVILPKQGISSIQALQQCENMMVLKLTSNSIENIYPLRKMKKMKILDIADNSVSNLDVLEQCKELVNLHLEGNLIKSLDNIKSLKSCSELRNLHLQNLSGEAANPICGLKNYRENCLQFLASLKRLDSIPRNVQLCNGSQLSDSKQKQLKIDIKNVGPFYTNKFPSSNAFVMPNFQDNNLKKSITNCKNSFHQLELRMRAALAM